MKVGRMAFDGQMERLTSFEDTMLRLRRGNLGQQIGSRGGVASSTVNCTMAKWIVYSGPKQNGGSLWRRVKVGL
jgi:hypothetical protein